jgi:hypothetical protein
VLIVIGTYLVGFREEFVCYVLLFDGGISLLVGCGVASAKQEYPESEKYM